MKQSTLDHINNALLYARLTHKEFAESPYQAVSIAAEEFGEWAQAVNDGNMKQARMEALHLAAVIVRFLEEVEG